MHILNFEQIDLKAHMVSIFIIQVIEESVGLEWLDLRDCNAWRVASTLVEATLYIFSSFLCPESDSIYSLGDIFCTLGFSSSDYGYYISIFYDFCFLEEWQPIIKLKIKIISCLLDE